MDLIGDVNNVSYKIKLSDITNIPDTVKTITCTIRQTEDDEENSPTLTPYTIGVTVDEKISDMKFFNIKFIACAFYPEDNCANISYEYVLKNSEDKEKHTKTFNVFYESKNSELSGFYHYFRTALKVGLEKCYYMCDENGSIDGAMKAIEIEFEQSFSAIYDLIQTAKTI